MTSRVDELSHSLTVLADGTAVLFGFDDLYTLEVSRQRCDVDGTEQFG